MAKQVKITFLIIVLLSAVLRFYKLDQIPPSLSWDEAAVGYNAYTIANWGADEWGRLFPLSFKSFEDDKHPIHVYLTALSVRLLGLSDFSTRLPAALFGVFNVIIIFFLAKVVFNNNLTGLFSALFLAISPYALQFSRFNHEANFALFFFMLGLLFFFLGKKKKHYLLPFSFLSFGISILTYHSSEVVVPPMILLLVILYFRDLWRLKRYFLASCAVILLIVGIIWFNPALLGTARIKQTAIPSERIENTNLFKKTHLQLLGRLEVAWQRYLAHLSTQYLFVSGDKNTKFSIQTVGTFYTIDALFLIVGFLTILMKRSKPGYLILSWAILAPIPPSISGGEGEVPHAARALFMMGSWHMVSAFGFCTLVKLGKNIYVRVSILLIGLAILGWLFKGYITEYYQNYGRKEAISWQYGMKQIVEYVKDHNDYLQIHTTDIRFQPYIFFLFYLKTPLPWYLETVVYTQELEHRKYSLVDFFDKYYFGDWDPIESYPSPGVLYVVTPSQYDGLRHRSEFEVKKIIYYPNGGTAFYLVSKN